MAMMLLWMRYLIFSILSKSLTSATSYIVEVETEQVMSSSDKVGSAILFPSETGIANGS